MSYDGEPGVAPVFVDASGRRARLARVLGLVVAAVCGLYLLLVGITLVAPPGVLPLSIPGLGRLLPGPGAPKLSDNLGRSVRPASVLTPAPSVGSPSPTAASGPGSSAKPGASATAGTVRPTGRPTATPTPVVTGRPTALPSATATGKPSPATRRTGKPTVAPTARSTRRP